MIKKNISNQQNNFNFQGPITNYVTHFLFNVKVYSSNKEMLYWDSEMVSKDWKRVSWTRKALWISCHNCFQNRWIPNKMEKYRQQIDEQLVQKSRSSTREKEKGKERERKRGRERERERERISCALCINSSLFLSILLVYSSKISTKI